MWLMDEKARDQFVIRVGTTAEVYWNDVVPELAYQKQVLGFLFGLLAFFHTVRLIKS